MKKVQLLISIDRIDQREKWNTILRGLPYAHVLQTWEWGEFKQQTTGWTPERFAYQDSSKGYRAAASVLTRHIGPFAVMYVPKGPALEYSDPALVEMVLDHLQKLAKKRHVIWLKIDPDLPLGTGIPGAADHPEHPDPDGQALKNLLERRGWRFSADQVQFRNTFIHDLSSSEDALLAGMNQSTRRKIRQAEKAGVVVREADLRNTDLQTLYDLYVMTGERQGFTTRPLDYYKTAWQAFGQAGLAYGLLAEVENRAVAGLILFHFGRKVWYFYGMSSNQQRDAQPNYALQWAALRWAKSQGYALYDWWGAPNQFDESDPMWGVFRFKEGFGGQVVRHIGAWDFVAYPFLYQVYEKVIPRILNFMRRKN